MRCRLAAGKRAAPRKRRAFLLVLALLSAVPAGFARDGRSRMPAVGARLPNVLAGALLRNAPDQAPPPEKGWIVYVFSPGSAVSRNNSDAVERLAAALPEAWALLALATEETGLEEFLRRQHVTVPVVTQVPAASLAAYGAASPPQTYLLDKDWKLLEVLSGELKGKTASRLSARVGITLPGPGEGPAPSPPEPGAEARSRHLCLNRRQLPYSPGAVVEALGLRLRCQAGGVWAPAS